LTAIEKSFGDVPAEPGQPVLATKDDTDAILDALKELTKVCSSLNESWEKWRKAGKF